MSENKNGCLICGKDIVYGETEQLDCFYCQSAYTTNAKCEAGHFICDKCHSSSSSELIETFCSTSNLEDPLELAITLMRTPQIKMHGPEHHFLIPAVLLAAYYNVIGDQQQKEAKIKEAGIRASKILGGFCGFYGDCGAAVGTGIFISLITDATPLSTEEWRLSNLMTSKSLLTIANHGGPRCCKRNSFLAIHQAIKFLRENLGVTLRNNGVIECEFKDLNAECLQEKCPYYPKN